MHAPSHIVFLRQCANTIRRGHEEESSFHESLRKRDRRRRESVWKAGILIRLLLDLAGVQEVYENDRFEDVVVVEFGEEGGEVGGDVPNGG